MSLGIFVCPNTMRLRRELLLVFFFFFVVYIGLAWLICGGERWWILDHVAGFNVFYGDDAYRFFLARSAWLSGEIYAYNYILPVALMLDGLVVTLGQGDLWLSRSIHALLAAGSLCLVWQSGFKLGIQRHIMTAAILVMGLMPFYAMISLSFYGEVWLGFLLSLLLFLFLHSWWRAVACVAGLLPLVRPEGLFLMAPLLLYFVKKRNWQHAGLMLFPGILYLFFLLVWLHNPLDAGLWRLQLRTILSKVPLSASALKDMVGTYTLLFLFPALLGWLFKPIRRLWPLLLGAMFWSVYLIVSVVSGLSDYEPRYTYSLIPVLALLWASFFSWIDSLSPRRSYWKVASFSLFFILVLLLHIYKVEPIKRHIDGHGVTSLIATMANGKWKDLFLNHSPETVKSWRSLSGKIENLLQEDDGIDKLVMFNAPLYYHVDPKIIPDDVQVAFPAMGYLVFHILLDGQIFIQHPGGRMYSYLRFGVPEYSVKERRALYADLMPMPNYPYQWQVGDLRLYLFSYLEKWEPEVDLDSAEAVTRETMVREFSRWRY